MTYFTALVWHEVMGSYPEQACEILQIPVLSICPKLNFKNINRYRE